MKIEIELSDIEKLKTRISTLEKDNENLKKELESLDKKVLKSNAIKLAQSMFSGVLIRVFRELGFNAGMGAHDCSFGSLEQQLGKSWWDNEGLKVELGATITTEFKNAFLHLGVKIDAVKDE